MRINKYQAIKTCVNGIEFDSRKEARRYQELLLLQRAGVIQDLRMQEKFLLIPSQFETIDTGEVYKSGSKKGTPKTKEVCIEKPVVYVADFVYTKDGEIIVEDTKGFKTKDYIIKRKLMLYTHGIRIREV